MSETMRLFTSRMVVIVVECGMVYAIAPLAAQIVQQLFGTSQYKQMSHKSALFEWERQTIAYHIEMLSYTHIYILVIIVLRRPHARNMPMHFHI